MSNGVETSRIRSRICSVSSNAGRAIFVKDLHAGLNLLDNLLLGSLERLLMLLVQANLVGGLGIVPWCLPGRRCRPSGSLGQNMSGHQ
jgi:hypothetical protein